MPAIYPLLDILNRKMDGCMANARWLAASVIVYFFRFMLSPYTTTLRGSNRFRLTYSPFYGLKRSPFG
jgi:hypothetical protein